MLTRVDGSQSLGSDAMRWQLIALNRVLAEVWRSNAFYQEKWRAARLVPRPLEDLGELRAYPFVTRADFAADQRAHPPFGTNLTARVEAYHRAHRSSGSSGTPLVWPETHRGWEWLAHRSEALHRVSGVNGHDRVAHLARFGCSLGPWVVHGGLLRLGCLVVAVDPQPQAEEARWLAELEPSVLVGKPSRLFDWGLELARRGLVLRRLGVRLLVSTGEPGGSVPELRRELSELWGAEISDRYGLTEAGPVAAECRAHPGGLHVCEEAFVVEILDPRTGEPVGEGDEGELVLTTLGRADSPIVRYRTGDAARLVRFHSCACGRGDPLLAGGVHRLVPLDSQVPEEPLRTIR